MMHVESWGSLCSSGQGGETPDTGLDWGGSLDGSEPDGNLMKESACFDAKFKALQIYDIA